MVMRGSKLELALWFWAAWPTTSGSYKSARLPYAKLRRAMVAIVRH
jgi:hypothetical protein